MPPSCALLGGFAIGIRVALLWQHYENESPAVIRQACRTPHAVPRTKHAGEFSLAGDNIDAPAACAVMRRSISSILRGCYNANAKC